MAMENGHATPGANGKSNHKRLKLTDIDEETMNSGAEGYESPLFVFAVLNGAHFLTLHR
jgi:hypothetical protein